MPKLKILMGAVALLAVVATSFHFKGDEIAQSMSDLRYATQTVIEDVEVEDLEDTLDDVQYVASVRS